jgi:RNA polymerase sigma-70 factor (ECF subfamily)
LPVYEWAVAAQAGAAGDDELISLARTGDVDAYGELVRRYQGIARRVARLVAGGDADDATQEAFMRAYDALSRFRDGAAFRPWLLKIVTNVAHNANRSRTRRHRLAERAPVAVDAAPPDEHALANRDRQRLWDALRALPENDRLVLAYRYLEGLSEAETAHALGVRPGTVKSRTSRALDRLRVALPVDEHDEVAR